MSITKYYYLGIDGGGTKCKARLEDQAGNILAEALAGPANAARDLAGSQRAILSACDSLLQQLQSLNIGYQHLHAGIGLAGANLPEVKQQLQNWSHPFASMTLSTDLHIACLGAHQGQDGAIIITGTGSSGASIMHGQEREMGGHGFVLGDKGSGAWLGKIAIAQCLEALDGLRPMCELSEAILTDRQCADTQQLLSLAINAKPSFFAELAPLVLRLAANNQSSAERLVREGADYISRLARGLLSQAPGRLSIIGGISALLIPWLDSDVQNLLSDAKLPPEAGAILLAKLNLPK